MSTALSTLMLRRTWLEIGFAILACALVVGTCLSSLCKFVQLERAQLPHIRADRAHQISRNTQDYLTYEIPSGAGFSINTEEFSDEYLQVESGDLFDPITTTTLKLHEIGASASESIDMHQNKHVYTVIPKGGLRPGQKFIVTIQSETYSWGHYNFSPSWSAYLVVK